MRRISNFGFILGSPIVGKLPYELVLREDEGWTWGPLSSSSMGLNVFRIRTQVSSSC